MLRFNLVKIYFFFYKQENKICPYLKIVRSVKKLRDAEERLKISLCHHGKITTQLGNELNHLFDYSRNTDDHSQIII